MIERVGEERRQLSPSRVLDEDHRLVRRQQNPVRLPRRVVPPSAVALVPRSCRRAVQVVPYPDRIALPDEVDAPQHYGERQRVVGRYVDPLQQLRCRRVAPAGASDRREFSLGERGRGETRNVRPIGEVSGGDLEKYVNICKLRFVFSKVISVKWKDASPSF